MKPSDHLLLNNKSWSQERISDDPDYFKRLAKHQKPEFMWIGCADSRVPANTITGTEPGEVFVHRNIANVCVATDLNMLSVLQYAVEVLQVKHVIVCGHYGCGGVNAAMSSKFMGSISHWLLHIRDVHHAHYQELRELPPDQRSDRLCELNVQAGATALARSSIIQEAWHRRGGPWVHAWIYSVDNGVLKELSAFAPGAPIDPAYRLEF